VKGPPWNLPGGLSLVREHRNNRSPDMAARSPSEDTARHPLPRSEEARHDLIPEHLEREKGVGDDSEAPIQPSKAPVTPDGEPYGEAAQTD
jgi:hypothetical protein